MSFEHHVVYKKDLEAREKLEPDLLLMYSQMYKYTNAYVWNEGIHI